MTKPDPVAKARAAVALSFRTAVPARVVAIAEEIASLRSRSLGAEAAREVIAKVERLADGAQGYRLGSLYTAAHELALALDGLLEGGGGKAWRRIDDALAALTEEARSFRAATSPPDE